MIPSAYIHVPFCSHLCRYCAFFKTLNLSHAALWTAQIEKEISCALSSARQADPEFALETIYIGGGTPSALNMEQTERLLKALAPYRGQGAEWTIEVNPESVSAAKLEMYRQFGINRISVGVQTFDEGRLKAIGRKHSPAQAKEAIRLIKKMGFSLSVDLMYGFEGETLEDVEADLDEILALNPGHISIYSLILEEESVMGKLKESGVEEELEAMMYERIAQKLCHAGYEHYEISSFARQGAYGKHNLAIWQDGLYYGFGPGACGRDEKGLYHHEQSLQHYLEHGPRIEYDQDATPWFDAIMTGLRTSIGVDIAAWNRRYNLDFESRYSRVLRQYSSCFERHQEWISLNEAGREILDSILVDFLMEES